EVWRDDSLNDPMTRSSNDPIRPCPPAAWALLVPPMTIGGTVPFHEYLSRRDKYHRAEGSADIGQRGPAEAPRNILRGRLSAGSRDCVCGRMHRRQGNAGGNLTSPRRNYSPPRCAL